LLLTTAGVWVGFGGLVLRRFFGAGSEANASVWFRSGRLPPISTIARGVLSIVAVGLGMSLGREAAVKQAGGAVASGLSGWAKLPAPHRRVLVACGIGAGMAAAYNVPFGGAMFALEVLLGTLSIRLVLPALAMSTIATAVSWMMLPTGPVYLIQTTHLSGSVVVWSILAGPIIGMAAAIFIRMIAWAGRIRLHGASAVIVPILTLSALGGVAILVPQVLGNGKEVVQLAFDGKIGLTLLLVLPVLKAITTAGCMAGGARGGLFTPTMTIGAVIGCLLGTVWSRVWPGANLGLYGLIGAAAMLGGATQGPVSSIVLMLELTRHGDATMVPMLFAVGGATLMASWLDDRSLYSARTSAAAVNSDHGPNAVSSADTLPAVMQKLLALPETRGGLRLTVLDDDDHVVGTIGRDDVEPSRFRPLPPTAVTAGDLSRVNPLHPG
jgi:CIC family chloride channel protein